jgi:hypothetical protein
VRVTIKRGTQSLSREEARLREKITRRVGQIVLNFSSIENALGLAYAMSHDEGPAHGGKHFYTDKTFAQKIQLVDKLADTSLAGERLKEWRRMRNRLHQVARYRNHMAHLVLVNRVQNRVITPSLQQPWFKPEREEVPRYALRDIEEIAAKVDAAREELWKFVQMIRGF